MTRMKDSSDDGLANRVAREMLLKDSASRALGMEIVEMREGYARLSLTVRSDMLNGHGNCFGGTIFSLADSAFAFACNSRNELTVAAGASIEFLRPAVLGDQLIAKARERAIVGRQGIYDVTVTNQAQKVVATFCGKSRTLQGRILPDS